MSNSPEIVEFMKFYTLMLESSAETAMDIRQVIAGQRVLYNCDYSAIYGNIWNPERSDRVNWSHRLCGIMLEQRLSLPFTPVFTSVSLLELLDSFRRRFETMETARAKGAEVEANIKRRIEEVLRLRRDVANTATTQTAIQVELAEIRSVLGGRLAEQVSKAESLIGIDGPIRGFGDVVEIGRIDLRDLVKNDDVTKLYDEMWPYRTSRDGREFEEKRFRYTVDAINILVSRSLSSALPSTDVDYLTRATYKSKFCPEDGRSLPVPYFWLVSRTFGDISSNEEKAEFFDWMKTECYKILRLLERKPNIRNQPTLGRLMESFQNVYLTKLLDVDEPTARSTDEYLDRLHDLIKVPKFAERRIEENLEAAEKRVASLMSSTQQILADELVNFDGLEALGYAQATMKRFQMR